MLERLGIELAIIIVFFIQIIFLVSKGAGIMICDPEFTADLQVGIG